MRSSSGVHESANAPAVELTRPGVQPGGGPGNRFAYFDCEAPGLSLIEILGFDAATRAAIEQMKQQAAAATAT